MNESPFPDPRTVDPETGILCYGGELTTEILLDAYSQGIFPWPHKGFPLLWFCPINRAVLFYNELHQPRSFKKWKKRQKINFKYNTCFEEVMRNCATTKRASYNTGTWITEEMIEAYVELHRKGYAHSIEGYLDGDLVCGLYGVCVNGVFSAESVFGRLENTTKLALVHTMEALNEMGIGWIDVQALTPLTRQFGGREVAQNGFFRMIKAAQENPVKIDWPSV